MRLAHKNKQGPKGPEAMTTPTGRSHRRLRSLGGRALSGGGPTDIPTDRVPVAEINGLKGDHRPMVLDGKTYNHYTNLFLLQRETPERPSNSTLFWGALVGLGLGVIRDQAFNANGDLLPGGRAFYLVDKPGVTPEGLVKLRETLREKIFGEEVLDAEAMRHHVDAKAVELELLPPGEGTIASSAP